MLPIIWMGWFFNRKKGSVNIRFLMLIGDCNLFSRLILILTTIFEGEITNPCGKDKNQAEVRPIRKRSKTPEIFAIIYDKNTSSSTKTITKTRYEGPDLTPVLSTSSMQSPQLSPSSQHSAQESSFNSIQSSSSSALSSQSNHTKETSELTKTCDMQSSIDIEIYNINNQIDDYNDYPLRGTTQLRPKINQRKQKPFRIDCIDLEVESASKTRLVSEQISSLLASIQSDKPVNDVSGNIKKKVK